MIATYSGCLLLVTYKKLSLQTLILKATQYAKRTKATLYMIFKSFNFFSVPSLVILFISHKDYKRFHRPKVIKKSLIFSPST